MKKYKVITVLGVVFIIIVGSFYYLIEIKKFRPFNEGIRSFSKSVSESKKRQVFVSSYNIMLDLDTVISSVKIDPKEVWLERLWYKGGFEDDTQIAEKEVFQTCIKLNNTITNYYSPNKNEFPTWKIYSFNENHKGFLLRDSVLENRIFFPKAIDSFKYPIQLFLSEKNSKMIGYLKIYK